MKNNSNGEDQNSQETIELPEIVDNVEISVSENRISNGIIASQDPRFLKFFKMLQVGVPNQAVKNKMALEGLDPSILE